MNNNEIFSRRMKELRGLRNKSEFARLIGVKSPSTYNYYENGRVPRDREVLHRIATVCDVTEAWLLGLDENEKRAFASCESVASESETGGLRTNTETDMFRFGKARTAARNLKDIPDSILCDEIDYFSKLVSESGIKARPGNIMSLAQFLDELLNRVISRMKD